MYGALQDTPGKPHDQTKSCFKIMNPLLKTIVAEPRISRPSQNKIGIEENLFPRFRLEPNAARPGATAPGAMYWSWACRRLSSLTWDALEDAATAPPAPGDVALMRVEKTEFHKYLTTAENRRLRLYPGAQFIGVFGNRYACDAFEAEVLGPDNLSLLTAAGMVGTVKSKHFAVADPTRISLLGFLRDGDGSRINLKQRLFQPATDTPTPRNLIYIVGTGMNCGKTTTAARLSNGLSNLGLNVVACK